VLWNHRAFTKIYQNHKRIAKGEFFWLAMVVNLWTKSQLELVETPDLKLVIDSERKKEQEYALTWLAIFWFV